MKMAGKWMVAVVTAVVVLLAGGAAAACTGDCGGDGQVTVDEVILGVNIALGLASAEDCRAVDSDGNGGVTVDELVSALTGALNGCTPESSSPTPTATATQPIATPTPICESDGVADLSATSASPEDGQGDLQIDCVTAENAGGTRTELTRVAGRGTVNGVELLLQIYFVTETGAIDTVSYGWSPLLGIPDAFANLAFCNAPAGCAGASVDLGTKTITLSNTALAGGDGQSAVLDGTITLDRIPTPIATPTPPCPGGSANLSFSEVEGTNSSQPLPANLVLGTAMNFSRPADPPAFEYLSALYDGCPMPFPRLTLGFQFSGAVIQAGTTYQVGSAQGQLNQIEFREEGFSNFKSWEAQSGTLIVDAVDSGVVSFRIVEARMRSRDIGTRGTFRLDVSGTLAPTPTL